MHVATIHTSSSDSLTFSDWLWLERDGYKLSCTLSLKIRQLTSTDKEIIKADSLPMQILC